MIMTNSAMSKIADPGIRDALRLKSAVLGKPLIGPKSVNIHIINSCNHRCEFCWYFSPWVKSQPKRKMLDYKVLERVLEDCREIGVDEINLEGGEVTLYPFWKDAFRKVKELGMRLIAYSHLDYGADHLPGLCYADRLTVNFSAITEESFKRVHGKKASMTRVLKNMDRLLAMRDKRGKPEIMLSFVVYNHNYQELAGFLDMARQRKVDQVVVRFFEATPRDAGVVFFKRRNWPHCGISLRPHCRCRLSLSTILKSCTILLPTGRCSTMLLRCRGHHCIMTGCYFMIRRAGASIVT